MTLDRLIRPGVPQPIDPRMLELNNALLRKLVQLSMPSASTNIIVDTVQAVWDPDQDTRFKPLRAFDESTRPRVLRWRVTNVDEAEDIDLAYRDVPRAEEMIRLEAGDSKEDASQPAGLYIRPVDKTKTPKVRVEVYLADEPLR